MRWRNFWLLYGVVVLGALVVVYLYVNGPLA